MNDIRHSYAVDFQMVPHSHELRRAVVMGQNQAHNIGRQHGIADIRLRNIRLNPALEHLRSHGQFGRFRFRGRAPSQERSRLEQTEHNDNCPARTE